MLVLNLIFNPAFASRPPSAVTNGAPWNGKCSEMPSCAIITCRARSQKSTDMQVSFHRFPKDPKIREQWINATGREYWVPRKLSTICSKHFTEDDFVTKQSGNKFLKPKAVPREKVVILHSDSKSTTGSFKKRTVKHEENVGQSSSSSSTTAERRRKSTINIVVEKANYKKEPSDDSESQVTEVPVTVKVEVDEEYISEHEEDIMEKIESRKRMQEKDPIAVDAKKLRVELLPVTESQPQTESQSQPQYVSYLPQQQKKCASHASQAQGKQQPDTSEPIVVPEFFMNVVVRNQNEILSILKKQVLLQDPDPELLTFLRFLGSKLLRYPKKKRDELQDRITEMLLLE